MEDLKKSFLVRGNNIVGFGGSGEENTIESISVNGVDIAPDENKNVDITVPSIDGLTKDADLATVAKSGNYEDLDNKPEIPSIEGLAKTTDIPTKVSELENDSNYLSSIPEEYITETELNAKGYLTEHQDLSAYATKDEIPTVPSKVSELTNDSNYQTAEQVNSTVTTEIAKVVADAPEDLNTLKEMSDWIAGHEDDASAMNSAISDNKTAITALQTGKADKSEIPTALPANGGNSLTVNGHTVKSDVPENAVFTDTVYDDTEVKESITELNSNLDALEFGEVAGGKNLFNGKYIQSVLTSEVDYTNRNLYNEFPSVSDITGLKYLIFGRYFKKGTYTFSYSNNNFLSLNRTAIAGSSCVISANVIRKSYTWTQDVDGYTYFTIEADESETSTADILFKGTPDIQIEEGSVATEYEPYIPSIKMLAEENAQQSTEAMDLKMLGWTVPKECPIQNYIDNDGVFHQRVGRVDLSSLKWSFNTGTDDLFYTNDNLNAKTKGLAVYNKYKGVTGNSYKHAWGVLLNDEIYEVTYINAPGYTDPVALKRDLTGVYLYYELAEEKTISVDGNEAVTKVNESLYNQGLLNKVTEMQQGRWNISSGVFEDGKYYVSSKEYISCNGNSNIKLKCDSAEAFDIVFFNGSSFISGESKNGSELLFTTPSNATSFKFNIYNGNQLTPQNIGKIEVYVDSQIEQLNSNLDELGHGENSGGRNIFQLDKIKCGSMVENDLVLANQDSKFYEYNWKPNTQYTVSFVGRNSTSNGYQRLYFEYTDGSTSEPITNNGTSFDYVSATSEVGKTIKSLNSYWSNNGSLIIKGAEIMIEEGTTATDYEPYIPSVKMLADEVSAQNESLEDYGLDNKSNNEWKQGYYDEEFNIVNSNGHICIGTFTCNGGDLVNIKTFNSYKQITVRYDNGSIVGDGSITTPHNEIEIIVPSGVTSFGVYVSNNVPITPSEGGNISVYVNNSIEKLKNDLDRIEGISTTEQIVGTFLGKNLYRNTIVLNFSTPFTVASGNNDTCINSSTGMESQASSCEGNIHWNSIDTLVNAESFAETSSYEYTNPFILTKDKTGYWYCHNVYGTTISATKIVLTLYYTKYN